MVLFKLQAARLSATRGLGQPGALRGLFAPPPVAYALSGVTRDGSGAPLAACTVDLFSWPAKTLYGSVTSDGAGAYRFSVGLGQSYRSVSYNANDTLAGSSAGNLVGA